MPFAQLVPNYVSAAVALSASGFLNGYDTGCIGSIVHMSQFADSFGQLSSLLAGITVSMIMLMGVPPALFAGTLADRYGRLKIIPSGALCFSVGAVLQGTAFNLVQFIIGRAVGGFGQGMFLGNVAIYITETAPVKRRGRLAALPQFMAACGVCTGYFSCYGTAFTSNSMAWRLPYIVQVVVSVSLAAVCVWLPESPRWLLLHGRRDEALRALTMLDFDVNEARRDFLDAQQERPSLSVRQSFMLLFKRAYRSRTLLALFVLATVQLAGIDAITYYAPALFRQAGIASEKSSLVSSGVASITMLVISIPGSLLVDKWGRRTVVISGGLTLSAIMLLMGSLYAAGLVKPTGAARWVVIVCVFLFGMVYCATWAIVTKIYASEIVPANTRAAANSLGMALCFFTNWIVALITPILLAASAFGAYFLFAGVTLFTVIVLTFYMPETRGRSLESIQSDFQRPQLETLMRILHVTGLRHRHATHGTETPGSDGIELNQSAATSTGAAALSTSNVSTSATTAMRLDVA